MRINDSLLTFDNLFSHNRGEYKLCRPKSAWLFNNGAKVMPEDAEGNK